MSDWKLRLDHLSQFAQATGASPCPALGLGVTTGAMRYVQADITAHLLLPHLLVSTHDEREGARKQGARAIIGDAFDARIAEHAFSIVVACPDHEESKTVTPYGWLSWWAARHLVPGGALLACLPDDAFFGQPGRDLAAALLRRFEPEAHRSMGLDRSGIRPVAVVLRALARPVRIGQRQAAEFADALFAHAALGEEHARFRLPRAPAAEPEPFSSTVVDEEDAMAALAQSDLWKDILPDAASLAARGRPPLPLRPGHVALQLAAGRLDGAVGQGDARHLVHGRVVRHRSTRTEETDEGEAVTTRDGISIEVATLDATGEFRGYSSAEGGDAR